MSERNGRMKDVAADVAKDWVTLALAGLGITFAPAHEYIGGLFLGLAGAGLAARMQPEKDRLELWAVFLGGFLASHLAALAAHLWLPVWPIQLVMAGGGFASRFAARIALRALGLVETRTEKISDRVLDRVFPGKEDGK